MIGYRFCKKLRFLILELRDSACMLNSVRVSENLQIGFQNSAGGLGNSPSLRSDLEISSDLWIRSRDHSVRPRVLTLCLRQNFQISVRDVPRSCIARNSDICSRSFGSGTTLPYRNRMPFSSSLAKGWYMPTPEEIASKRRLSGTDSSISGSEMPPCRCDSVRSSFTTFHYKLRSGVSYRLKSRGNLCYQ
jgi:hypothetical protein